MSVASLFSGAACLADRQPLTLESIFASQDLQNRTVENLQWNADGSAFTFTGRNPESGLPDIYEQNIASGANRLVVRGDAPAYDGAPVRMSWYRWTNDRRFLLITGPETLTWDNVVEAPHYLYELATGELRPLADNGSTLRNVRLSPDGRHVGYVFDNDIYVTEVAGGAIRAITSDGSPNVFNGIFDYGSSEFGSEDAWIWSPDGSKVAFWRLDVTDVKVFYMIDELGQYNEVRALKYPNTGEKHAVNRIGVFDLESGGTKWMDIGDNVDDYIPRISWAGSSQTLAIQRLSRDHKTLDLLLGDTETGETRVIVTDTDPAWVDTTDDLMFLGNQRRFVWTSEKSGYRHAYLYDFEGDEVPLTRGDWEITSL
ncbi:MAG: DPP IV N-terminal domain-containing protein, partial [Woeseiaceae bacterium]